MEQKNCLIALSLLLLTSCTTTKPLDIVTIEKPIEIVQPSRPAAITLSDINWKVIDFNDTIYYSLTIQDYKLLATNMLEIKRYIVEQKNIITYYENTTGDKNGTRN